MTVMEFVQELYTIYGDGCVDPDFVRRFLDLQGLTGKYNVDSVIDTSDGDLIHQFVEWIPTQTEVEEHIIKNKNKQR